MDKQDQNQMIEIIELMERAMTAIDYVNSIVGNKEKNVVSIDLTRSIQVANNVINGLLSKEALLFTVNTIMQAKRTLDLLDTALEHLEGTNLISNLEIAFVNAYRLMKGEKRYFDYYK